MITVLPTTESGLNHSDWRLDMPGEINPIRERAQKITTTINGGAAVTIWPKNNQGAQQKVTLILSAAKFTRLEAIVNHQTVFEWLVLCDGRRYTCSIDYMEPVSIGVNDKQVQVTFTVV